MTTASGETVWDRISLIRGDITTQRVDAIVNAANGTLLGGGGVDGAIHRAAGSELLDACSRLGGCPTGSAKITPGFNLAAGQVIHAVGPRYRDGRHGEPEALASCYRTVLKLADEHGCDTIAFPAISCGVYAYPIGQAARISIGTVAEALAEMSRPRHVSWVLFDERAYGVFASVFGKLKGG